MVFVHVVGGRRPMRGVTGFSPGRKGKVHRYGPRGSRIEVTWYLNMLTDHFIDHLPFGALDHKFVVKSGRIGIPDEVQLDSPHFFKISDGRKKLI